MPILTMEQIAGYASAAGLSGEPLATATAIAMAESEGDTDAVGDTRIVSSTWGPSIGLWQIRSINSQRGTGGERDETANRNPANNAKAMMSISSGGKNWLPWSVYTTGKYRQFLAAARLAAHSPAIPSGASAAPAAGGVDLLDGGTWARAGLFVFGGSILAFALYKASGSPPLPIGGVAKLVKKVA
jgi:hypothetical protein